MINMKSEKTIMLSLAIALAIALVGVLIVVPVIEEAQAADDRNKGKQGEIKSKGKRRGGDINT
jgi:hypothetical protein